MRAKTAISHASVLKGPHPRLIGAHNDPEPDGSCSRGATTARKSSEVIQGDAAVRYSGRTSGNRQERLGQEWVVRYHRPLIASTKSTTRSHVNEQVSEVIKLAEAL